MVCTLSRRCVNRSLLESVCELLRKCSHLLLLESFGWMHGDCSEPLLVVSVACGFDSWSIAGLGDYVLERDTVLGWTIKLQVICSIGYVLLSLT